MPSKTVTIYRNYKVTIPWNYHDAHAKKEIGVYVEILKSAKIKIDYRDMAGATAFGVIFNNHRLRLNGNDEIYCGWGGCEGSVSADVTDVLVNGVNTFDLHYHKVLPFDMLEKSVWIDAYLIVEYEGQPPEQPKKMNVVLLQGKRIDLTQMDSGKRCKVAVTALWNESRTKVLEAKLKTTWEVNVSQMACDIYWNGEKVHDYYCGWGQCQDSRESVVQLINGVNDLTVEVYKPIWHPWGSTTIVSAILEVTYIGDKPMIKVTPPLPDWITWVKYGAIAGGCMLGGYVIAKSLKGGEKK